MELNIPVNSLVFQFFFQFSTKLCDALSNILKQVFVGRVINLPVRGSSPYSYLIFIYK